MSIKTKMLFLKNLIKNNCNLQYNTNIKIYYKNNFYY